VSKPQDPPVRIVESVHVYAPPADVWEVVSDVTRMGEWSPECRKVVLVGGGPVREGLRMVGVNRRGLAVWPTLSTVVRLEPGRVLAWRTRESGATWTYELEPVEGGTTLTGRRDLDGYTLLTRVAAPLIGGAAGHDNELAAGIRTTLRRMKAVVERSAQATH
jgi:uncharacterized protein YndB with AHSA1/START domain